VQDVNRQNYFDVVEREFGREFETDVLSAYQLSKALHRTQSRKTGERYFEHPRAVALQLFDMGPSTPREQILALLHDSVEDCWILPSMLGRLFGADVQNGVELLSECTVAVRERGRIQKTALPREEYFVRLKHAPQPVRRVKVSDRLHNLRTMRSLSAASIRRKIDETRVYVLPIAHMTDTRFYAAIDEECRKLELLVPTI